MDHTFAIAIPTYQGDDLLARCLESLAQQAFPPNCVEIIVVSNGPETHSQAITNDARLPVPVHHFYSETAGISNARNIALKNSEADVVVFFDNDMTFPEHCISSYGDQILKYGVNRFYGGAVEPDYEEEPPQWLLDFLPWSAKSHSKGDDDADLDQPWFLGGNHAVPRLLTLSVGGYDQGCAVGEGGAVGEETRLQSALIENGTKGRYVGGAYTYHYVPKSRCSEKWALKRNFRSGLTKAQFTAPDSSSTSLLGVPIWVCRLYLKFFSRRLKAIVMWQSKKSRFEAAYHMSFYWGYIQGCYRNYRSIE